MKDIDLISVLMKDHDELRQLLTEMEHLQEGEPLWRSMADLTIAEMVRHAIIEETYLYPIARERLPEGQRFVDRDISDHAELEEMVKGLETSDLSGHERSRLMSRLGAATRVHTRLEEEDLFPLLAKHLSGEELTALGRKAVEARKKTPTRESDSEPECPLLTTIIVSGTGLVERLRSHLSGLYSP